MKSARSRPLRTIVRTKTPVRLAMKTDDSPEKRREILKQLDEGEISAEEAAELIKQLRRKRQ